MRRITRSDRGGPPDPEAYWRRRFIILGGGLGALMLAAWAFGSGGASPAASHVAAAQASMAARVSRSSLPSTAYGRAWTTARPVAPASSGPGATVAGLTSPGPSPKAARAASPAAARHGTATPRPGTSPRGTATPHATASHGGAAAPHGTAAVHGAGGSGNCARGAIVLSLFTSEPAYSPSQQPKFDVYAVSTSSSGCEMPFGPSAARVVVTRHGQVVWDSAACKPSHPASAQPVRFTQGVPQEVAVSWNRGASSQGCAGSLTHGESGTFDAVAMADGFTSRVRSFVLRP